LLDAEGRPQPRTDTFSGRESIEFFLQAPGQSSYRQIVVSLDGYRYDSTGMEPSWNGTWESAVGVAEDRWFLEMRVPAQDLGVPRVAPAEGWRLNLCCDQATGSSTWRQWQTTFITRQLGRFDRPGFHRLAAEPAGAIAAEEGPFSCKRPDRGPRFTRSAWRLSRPRASPAPSTIRPWIGKPHAGLRADDYVGHAYRCLEEELQYRGFFQ